MIRLLAHPLPTPHLPYASCLSFSVFLCVAGRASTDGREGVGEEPNHTTAERKTDPLEIIQYSLILYKPCHVHDVLKLWVPSQLVQPTKDPTTKSTTK
jgi:hypothetical protein